MQRRCARMFLAAALSAGCGHLETSAPGVASPAVKPAPPSPEATGVWDWVFRSSDDQGNLRVEQEEWHLVQSGGTVEGYYDRAVTLLSTDDRLFRCNQKLGFTRFTRVRVTGAVAGKQVQFKEVSFDTTPGPCDDGARSLVSYDGELGSATLRLSWAADGAQTLHRRENEAGPRLAQMMGLEPQQVAAAAGAGGRTSAVEAMAASPGEKGHSRPLPTASIPIAGDWEWQLHSIDAEGDDRTEREKWHIVESSEGITGYYDRQVMRTRGDGTFPCNGRHDIATETRYQLSGNRIGGMVVISETEYKASPSGCDNGLRRLDTYQGTVAPGGEELILSWGPGNQILRRAKSPEQ